jgi:putative photosynthetic complex assembly protein 2
MTAYALPALYALFVWWASTAIIIYLDGLPSRTFRWSMLGATILLGVSIYGLGRSSHDASATGAYLAFTCAVMAWGWQEISFYMGAVTGLPVPPCAEGCSGWKHLGHAIKASLYHELAIIASGLAVFSVTWPGTNHVGLWTFVVLWWMHQSAKLNVLLGVPNLSEQFLPEHMAFLKSFLTKKPMNLLFPVSVSASTVVAVLLWRQAVVASSAFELAGFTFLGTLMVLAIAEHWFLVLPLPFAALWNWVLRARKLRSAFDAEIIAGFLGSGKTTFIRRLLAGSDPAVRTLVLVNDFGALGIDGSLLDGRGAEIVELANGCICCSLRHDLERQLQSVILEYAPQRVVIEPSGLADVAALMRVLGQPGLRPLVRSLRVCAMIDASSFIADFGRMPAYFEAQAELAPLLIVNKTDLVSAAELNAVTATLRQLNPRAVAVNSVYGLVDAEGFDPRAALVTQSGADDWPEHLDDHRLETAAGFSSWSTRLDGACHPQGLQDLLDSISLGGFGAVERVKGIARAGAGWVHFDVAGGRTSMAAFAPQSREEPRVTAIGRGFDWVGLQAAFEACAEKRGEYA